MAVRGDSADHARRFAVDDDDAPVAVGSRSDPLLDDHLAAPPVGGDFQRGPKVGVVGAQQQDAGAAQWPSASVAGVSCRAWQRAVARPSRTLSAAVVVARMRCPRRWAASMMAMVVLWAGMSGHRVCDHYQG